MIRSGFRLQAEDQITFPLSGQLAGVTVRATLDANSLVTKVETRPDNTTLASLATQTDYANYADRGEVLSDIKSPGRIIRRQGGRTLLDVELKTWKPTIPTWCFQFQRTSRPRVPVRVNSSSISAGPGRACSASRRYGWLACDAHGRRLLLAQAVDGVRVVVKIAEPVALGIDNARPSPGTVLARERLSASSPRKYRAGSRAS